MADADLTLADAVAIGRRRILLIAGVMAAVLSLTVLATLLPEPRYESEAKVAIQRSTAQAVLEPDVRVSNDSRELSNEVGFARSDVVVQALVERFGAEPDVTISPDALSDVLEFRASAPTPELAADWANAWAEEYLAAKREQALDSIEAAIVQLQERLVTLEQERDALVAPVAALEVELAAADDDARSAIQAELDRVRTTSSTQLAILDSRIASLSDSITTLEVNGEVALLGTGRILQFASPPLADSSGPLARNLVLGLIAGAILAAIVATVAEKLDVRIRTAEDVARAVDKPIMATVPRTGRVQDGGDLALVALRDPQHPVANGYHRLRTAIQYSSLTRDVRSLLITSAHESEGKTTTAMCLAASSASVGRTTVLIDADLRRGRIEALLGLDGAPGISEHLVGAYELAELENLPDPGNTEFVAICAGATPPNPADLLSSSAFTHFVAELEQLSDLLVIDAPPVLPVPDSLQIAPLVDGVLVVAHAGRTRISALRQCVESLEQVDAYVLGVVLVGVKGAKESYYYRPATRSRSPLPRRRPVPI